MGKALIAMKNKRERLFSTVMCRKKHAHQAVSEYLSHAAMFFREDRNLEGYFDRQISNFAKDINTKAAKLEW